MLTVSAAVLTVTMTDELTQLQLEPGQPVDHAASSFPIQNVQVDRRVKQKAEFTSAFVDCHILFDQHKTERYTSLRNRLQACLGSGWSVEIMPFSLGIQGSYSESSSLAVLRWPWKQER